MGVADSETTTLFFAAYLTYFAHFFRTLSLFIEDASTGKVVPKVGIEPT